MLQNYKLDYALAHQQDLMQEAAPHRLAAQARRGTNTAGGSGTDLLSRSIARIATLVSRPRSGVACCVAGTAAG